MAGEGASAGEVYVDILPKSDNFWSRFQAQTRAQASRVGDELGGVLGRSIQDSIAKGIRDGLSRSARAEAARSGAESGGAYGDAFKQRINAVLRGGFDANVRLDSSQATRDITELRAQLDRLRNRDLTVRVDVTAAYVDVVSLREELNALGRQRPSVRADVDTAGAMAQTAALIAELRTLGTLNPTVRPDVDDNGVRSVGSAARGSALGMRDLIAAGLLLGPAIVPSAAAAAAAIAGITPLAIGAAGGIGVLAMASVGVVGAVKAMSAADDQAAQSAVSLAGNQARLASAADAVSSAQAGLANATANAADSQRRASQAIVTAEQSETDAHRTLLQAQQAVTQARIDAARAAQDLQSRVANNAIDQRQAALDVAKAEEALAAARAGAGPGADNSRTVQEAQIALDRQRQRVTDLQTEHQRLADDKARSDRVGVDGSTQVVAALDRVRQATEAVHKAEQATADARAAYTSQARQSAASIAQAQQGIVSAQRSLQQATEQTATAGGAAMLKLQQSMADLSPEGQRFATFLYGLRPVLLDLRHAAEGGLLPGAQQGIEAMLPTVPRLTGYVRAFSGEVGHLAAEGGRAFASPYWTNWTDLMVSRAIPAMDTAARIAGNMALGVAGLVRASLPLGGDFAGGLLRFSERFAVSANTLEHSQGYRAVLDYIRVQGPVVAHTIGEVVTATVRLVEAIAPIGGVSLTVIRLLAETINALPVPVLTVLAGAIIGVVTATRAWHLAQTLFKDAAPAWTAAQLLIGQTADTARTAMANAGTEAGVFGRALAGVKGGAEGAIGGIGGLAGMIGPGGALAVGFGVAAVGLGILATKMAEQKAKTDQAVAAYERFGDAVARAREAGQPDNTADLIKNDKALQDLILHANQYGISGKTVVDALAGQRGAFGDVNTALAAHRAELVKVIQEHTVQGGKGQRVMDETAQKAANEVRHLDELAGRFGTVAQDQARAKDAADLYSQAQDKSTGSAQVGTPAQQALGEALRKVADETSTAAQKADALRAADEAVFGAARAAIRSQEDQAAAEDALAAAGKRNADAHIFGTATLDLHTEAGRNNRRVLEDRLLALGQEYLADVQAGVGVDDATKKHDTNRDALVNAAKAAGFDTTEVGKLATTFGTLPTDPKVQVTVSGVQTALTELQNLEIAQLALKQGLDPAEATRQYKKQRAQANSFLGQGGLATGGPVFGPGGPTEDKIPVWLSNGEHVITAREVQAAGGHQAIEMWRKLLLGGGQPQALYPGDGSGGLKFARGGAVTWPFPATAAMTKIPTLADVRRVVLFGPDYTGRLDGGLEAAAAFVRNQVGKPYGWAQAGPYLYDCSGIVSAAWNVAHGRYPYSHTFSTMNEAGYFPRAGYGPFTAAWTNPGERGVGGGPDGVGHTAARIGNYTFESVGGQGVRAGSGVTPLGRFAHIGHYDSGGDLPPGLTIAYNGTGKTEKVRTAEQEAALAKGGATITIPVTAGDGMSVHELASAVAGEIAWLMR